MLISCFSHTSLNRCCNLSVNCCSVCLELFIWFPDQRRDSSWKWSFKFSNQISLDADNLKIFFFLIVTLITYRYISPGTNLSNHFILTEVLLYKNHKAVKMCEWLGRPFIGWDIRKICNKGYDKYFCNKFPIRW